MAAMAHAFRTTLVIGEIDLNLIDEANLISARINLIELDLQAFWQACSSQGETGGADVVRDADFWKCRLTEVIIHAWPRPDDPVVVALRQQAYVLMAELDKMQKSRCVRTTNWAG
jgi:hypothetical protein